MHKRETAPTDPNEVVHKTLTLSLTSSIRPKARASSGDMKLSRSFALEMTSAGRPQWCAYSPTSLSRTARISFAWISMSVAWLG